MPEIQLISPRALATFTDEDVFERGIALTRGVGEITLAPDEVSAIIRDGRNDFETWAMGADEHSFECACDCGQDEAAYYEEDDMDEVCAHVVALVVEAHARGVASNPGGALELTGMDAPTLEPVPATLTVGMPRRSLDAWAIARGVEPLLTKEIGRIGLARNQQLPWDQARREVASAIVQPTLAKAHQWLAPALIAWLEGEALGLAKARAELRARLAARTRPSDETLVSVFDAVAALAERIPGDVLRAKGPESPSVWVCLDEPLRLHFRLPRACGVCGAKAGRAPFEYRVEPAPALYMNCKNAFSYHPAPCPWTVGITDAILDALIADPLPAPIGELREAILTPPWRRALLRLGPAPAAAPLALHAVHGTTGFTLKVVRAVPKKRGGVRLEKLAACPEDASGEERIWFAALLGGQFPGSIGPVGSLLAAVAGQDRLYIDEDPLPVQVCRAPVTLTAMPSGTPSAGLALGYEFRGSTRGLATLREPMSFGEVHIWEWDAPSRTLFVGELPATLRRVALATAARPLIVPAEAGAELVRQLVRLDVPLTLPEALGGVAVESLARPVVRATWRRPVLTLAFGFRHHADYPVLPPCEGPERLFVSHSDGVGHIDRDFDSERRSAADVAARLGVPVDALSAGGAVIALNDAPAVLAALRDAAADEGLQRLTVEWATAAPKVTVLAPEQVRIDVSSGRDWFGISGGTMAGRASVPLGLLLRAIRERLSFVELGPDEFVVLGERVQQALAPVAALADVTKAATPQEEWRVSRLGAAVLADVTETGLDIRAPESWTTLIDRVRASHGFVASIPSGLQAELRPYQVDGYQWLARLSRWSPGALLCDDMGLGKTVQAIALLLERRAEGPILVVAPTSVGFNWVRELERFAPALSPRLFRGVTTRSQLQGIEAGVVLITNYDLLASYEDEFTALRWGTVVLDEAQAIKNATTHRARAAYRLDAGFRLGLTGTPIENRADELWSLVNATVPGLLGSFERFRERFGAAIDRRSRSDEAKALSRIIRPFMLRRLKREVALDLPARTDVTVEVELSDAERTLYDQIRVAALEELAKKQSGPPAQRRIQVLTALTRLRQAACHPKLLDPKSRVPSSKLAAVLDILEELRSEGHRALVFSQFTSHLGLVREALDGRGITYRSFDGSTPAAARKVEVDAFQSGCGEVFLLSLKAGGTGLNLTGADYVIHLDPWWNPAVEDQASDRAHRIGQTRPVTVYRIVAKGTLEQNILGLHGQKRDLVASLLDGTSSAAALTTDELLGLIEASATGPGNGEPPPPLGPAVSEPPPAPARIAPPVLSELSPPSSSTPGRAKAPPRNEKPRAAAPPPIPTVPRQSAPPSASALTPEALQESALQSIANDASAGFINEKTAAWYSRVVKKLVAYFVHTRTPLTERAIDMARHRYLEDVYSGRYPGASSDRIVVSTAAGHLSRAAGAVPES